MPGHGVRLWQSAKRSGPMLLDEQWQNYNLMLNLLKSSLLLPIAMIIQGSMLPDRLWQGGPPPAAKLACELKIVSWNIERGEKLSDVAAALKQMNPSIALLQECDMNARRTDNKNIAEELALQLGLHYLFAAEFEELGQGVRGRPAYHGQALLTALPFSSVRIIRFQEQTKHWQPRWYLPNWAVFQRRFGGRLALVMELGTGPHRLVAYNVHLESRGGEERRLRQIEEVIADARRYASDTPILIAGDLNTRQANPSAVNALLKAGFRKAAGQEITTTHGTALDWIFVRGPLSYQNAEVHRQVRASDHFPLSVQLRFQTPDCRQ
ncbi:MAG: endonuclease/exonuclease/phosphatase family protein [Acidobacteria bacterium]|nr:endonuclease/exonuclease/phosphatase family protein [Acidobacteriota bacterium]